MITHNGFNFVIIRIRHNRYQDTSILCTQTISIGFEKRFI
jgi:hypothetical protein